MGREKKTDWAKSMSAGVQHELQAGKSGGSLHDRFAAAEALMAPQPSTVGGSQALSPPVGPPAPAFYLPLDDIKLREDAVRLVHEGHALDLALSIAAVGLIHFPVVNARGEVLAGGQRLAALEFLSLFRTLPDNDIRRLYSYQHGEGADVDLDGNEILTDEQLALLKAGFQRHFPYGIPVHRIDVESLPVATQTLTIESIENEKRLDFTKAELLSIMSKLKAAGFRDKTGRPKVGERTLATELERITGKSRRTVFRLLEELRGTTATPPPERAPSDTSRAITRRLTDHLALAVTVRESAKKRGEGSIVIRYRSFQERADALRKMGVKE